MASAWSRLGAQRRLVDPVSGLGVLKDQPAVQRRTTPVGSLEEVGQDRVGVHLRITLPRAAVREIRTEEPQLRSVLPVDAVAAEAGDTRMPCKVPDGSVDRRRGAFEHEDRAK